MTLARLVLILAAGLLFTAYKFENGRVIQSVSAQTVELGYRFNDTISQIVRRIVPNR
jgi:hypothetical protein